MANFNASSYQKMINKEIKFYISVFSYHRAVHYVYKKYSFFILSVKYPSI